MDSFAIPPGEPLHLAARRRKSEQRAKGSNRHSPYAQPSPGRKDGGPTVRSVLPKGQSASDWTVVVSEAPGFVASISSLHWNVSNGTCFFFFFVRIPTLSNGE